GYRARRAVARRFAAGDCWALGSAPLAPAPVLPAPRSFLRRRVFCVRACQLFSKEHGQAIFVALVERVVELDVKVPVLHAIRGSEDGAALQSSIEPLLQFARLDTSHELVDGCLDRCEQRGVMRA